jgi:hypothetical protein
VIYQFIAASCELTVVLHVRAGLKRCFIRTNMDCLVIENYLLLKSEQPEWKDDKKWMQEFELD